MLSTSVLTAASTDGAAYVPGDRPARRHGETSRLEQGGELVELAAHEVGGEQRNRVRSDETRGELDERLEGRLPVECTGNDDGHGSDIAHDARHLADRRRAIGQEHQRHLAQDDVERAVGERERCGVGLPPFDVGTDPAGDGEHRLVEVDADDAGSRPGQVSCGAGDDAGTAGDVEHAAARCHPAGLAQRRRPLGEEVGHERRLVALGGGERDLERL